MKNTPEIKKRTRAAPRNPTEAAISCRPYTSSGAVHLSDGVMRNFSSDGSYIETAHEFKSGTILIVRTLFYPSTASTMDEESRPRTICLAEVKWRQELADVNAVRFGMGLRYLD